ncbi:hypothetical protein H4219_002906 [Mycoemilia scoparia]|uniref:Deacetylase sirtuin-type domain-containing protein n=1 Tax=Mycoemilia scoparia TaxID=417184 RepID=A0A9W8DNJ5_9FUNG|nr:hypothetical protein H4219_002906 [Mycoemilia scoparia]
MVQADNTKPDKLDTSLADKFEELSLTSQSMTKPSDSPDDKKDSIGPPSTPPRTELPQTAPNTVSKAKKDKKGRFTLSPAQIRRSLRHREIVDIISDSTIESIAEYIKSGKGIPDFRSPKTGLYANLQRFNLPFSEAIFDMDYFVERPEPFYLLAKELYPGNFKPTPCHYFIRLLQDKGILLRNFTQNIDTLERIAGVDPDKLVESHGSFHTGHCILGGCRKNYSQDWIKDKVPRCTECGSLVKPDITFFGESLPSRFFDCVGTDFDICDLVIVMGTSLQVYPFASLIDHTPDKVPRLLINREKVGKGKRRGQGFDFDLTNGSIYRRDAFYKGDCDTGCLKLAKLLGWEDDLQQLINEEQKMTSKSIGKENGRREVVELSKDLVSSLENLNIEDQKTCSEPDSGNKLVPKQDATEIRVMKEVKEEIACSETK